MSVNHNKVTRTIWCGHPRRREYTSLVQTNELNAEIPVLVHALILVQETDRTVRAKTKNKDVFSAPFWGLVLLTTIIGCSDSPINSHDIDIQLIQTDAKPGSSAPHLATNVEGPMVLSWLEPNGTTTELRYSTFNGDEWAPSSLVTKGSSWFVNWADFPSVVPISKNLWAAHWLVRQPVGGFAYDVAIARSNDGGITWSDAEKPHRDGTPTEHGFASLVSYNNKVLAVWLDGREMRGGHHGSGDKDAGGMTLRSAIAAKGESFQASELVDDLVCDCCQTDVAIADSGPILVYRDRSSDEIRDIYISRLLEGHWEKGRSIFQDNWRIGGCPVNGPAIAAHKGTVIVAWYSEANSAPRVLMARSDNDGASFNTPVTIDAERPIGRVDIDVLENGDAVVSWIGKNDADGGLLLWRTVSRTGSLGPLQQITNISTRRNSGFPQMSRIGDRLLFAWTDVSEARPIIRTARVVIPAGN